MMPPSPTTNSRPALLSALSLLVPAALQVVFVFVVNAIIGKAVADHPTFAADADAIDPSAVCAVPFLNLLIAALFSIVALVFSGLPPPPTGIQQPNRPR